MNMRSGIALALTVLVTAVLPQPAKSLEVAGVAIPEAVKVAGEKLVLNGAGVRKKFVVKVYAGSLYLRERRSDAEDVLALPGPKRISMHFLYKKVEADSIVEAWREGFERNLGGPERDALSPRIDRFCELFRSVGKDDVYDLDFIPGEGTVVTLNGSQAGTVAGDDFFGALLRVWIGPLPADGKLKEALLGG